MILITILTTMFLYGICKGIKDQLSYHFGRSWTSHLDPLKWNPNISWKNKYKNGDPKQGEKFLFSTTLLVWTTDWWHKFDMLQTMILLTSICIVVSLTLPYKFILFLVLWIMKTIGFKIFYRN